MADYYINPTGPGSAESIVLRIDADNNATDKELLVEKYPGGAGNQILEIFEDKHVVLYGPISCTSSQVKIDRTGGSGDVATFALSGTVKARITSTGLGDFTPPYSCQKSGTPSENGIEPG